MSASFARTDTSVLGRWWWTVDRWNLAALITLVGIGVVLTWAASPPAADRMGLDTFHFVRHQMAYLPLALGVMLIVSLLPPRWIRRLGVMVFLAALVATALTLAIGPEYKGAQRWLSLGGMSAQPSEFLKPGFAVFCAWMLVLARQDERFPALAVTAASGAIVVALLLAQPDLGMAAVIVSIWFVAAFLAGLPARWILALAALAPVASLIAYAALPHIAQRIHQFVDPAAGGYQASTSLKAFVNGGLFGTGPGSGTIKAALPDAHSDFVFAVVGEEFGLFACLVIVSLYAFVVLRGFSRSQASDDLFALLASAGLLAGFGLQALVNMASSLGLIPTKGMTLPFLSYGGSSLLALGLGMGMVLALTRWRDPLAGAP